MDLVTFLLLGLIAAFGLGNVFLMLTKPKFPVFRGETVAVAPEVLQDPSVVAASQIALNQKIGLLNERVSRIEGILAQLPLDALQQRFDLADTQQKISRLWDFKNHIEIEVVALRDALQQKGLLASPLELERLEKDLGVHESALSDLDSEIRARVFNSKRVKP